MVSIYLILEGLTVGRIVVLLVFLWCYVSLLANAIERNTLKSFIYLMPTLLVYIWWVYGVFSNMMVYADSQTDWTPRIIVVCLEFMSFLLPVICAWLWLSPKRCCRKVFWILVVAEIICLIATIVLSSSMDWIYAEDMARYLTRDFEESKKRLTNVVAL